MNERTFRDLCDEAVMEADKLLDQRGEEYNRPPVKFTDYFAGIDDPEKSAFDKIWTKIIRLRSAVLSPEPGEEDKRKEHTLDAINQLRFLFVIIKNKQSKT